MTIEINRELPKGSFMNGSILVTSYFDSEGRLKYFTGVEGDLNIAQVLGLLVLGGITIYSQYIASEPYESDEIDEEESTDE